MFVLVEYNWPDVYVLRLLREVQLGNIVQQEEHTLGKEMIPDPLFHDFLLQNLGGKLVKEEAEKIRE